MTLHCIISVSLRSTLYEVVVWLMNPDLSWGRDKFKLQSEKLNCKVKNQTQNPVFSPVLICPHDPQWKQCPINHTVEKRHQGEAYQTSCLCTWWDLCKIYPSCNNVPLMVRTIGLDGMFLMVIHHFGGPHI